MSVTTFFAPVTTLPQSRPAPRRAAPISNKPGQPVGQAMPAAPQSRRAFFVELALTLAIFGTIVIGGMALRVLVYLPHFAH